jgi:hypothetical protein
VAGIRHDIGRLTVPGTVRRAALGLVLAAAALACPPARAADRPPLRDEPVVWHADDRRPVPVPRFAEPGLVPYAYDSFVARPFSRFFHPGRLVRRLGGGGPGRPAGNVNALDEVVDSSWFTNRIGVRRLSDEELTRGPALGTPHDDGPDRSGPWTIIGAKTSGVTPGFRIRDARGDTWLLKFDPPQHPGMTIRAGVVSNLLFHAIGYNTPVDRVVDFTIDDLVIREGTTIALQRGVRVPLTEANLDSVLTATNSVFDGRFQALASRYLDGIPLGPFDDEGVRDDDPNDVLRHQDRRELRALKVFGAWVNHFDIKMHNSLDMYVGEPGHGWVRHHLIDFASTLGAFGDQPVKRFGHEYGLDVFPVLGRLVGLGLVEDAWVHAERPEGLDEVGLFEVDHFAAGGWKPDLPHSGVADCTRADGYWAAKVLSAFSDRDLELIVARGRYGDPAAAAWVVRTLAARRDRLVRYWFGEVPPLDWFTPVDGGLAFADLGVERAGERVGRTLYRCRLAAVTSDREARGWTDWVEMTQTVFPTASAPAPDDEHPFIAVRFQVRRGDGAWSSEGVVYWSPASGRILGVER